MRLISAYAIGLIFGLGIVISGMGNPAKVINFFDVAGTWDASLALVMGGALAVTFFGYRLVLPRPGPLQAEKFHLPAGRRIDARLVGGALVFGVGWGISGFCPGGALPVIGTFAPAVLIFILSLVAGVIVARALQGHRQHPILRRGP